MRRTLHAGAVDVLTEKVSVPSMLCTRRQPADVAEYGHDPEAGECDGGCFVIVCRKGQEVLNGLLALRVVQVPDN